MPRGELQDERRWRERDRRMRERLRRRAEAAEARRRWHSRIVGVIAFDALGTLEEWGGDLTDESVRKEIIDSIVEALDELSKETPDYEKLEPATTTE